MTDAPSAAAVERAADIQATHGGNSLTEARRLLSKAVIDGDQAEKELMAETCSILSDHARITNAAKA